MQLIPNHNSQAFKQRNLTVMRGWDQNVAAQLVERSKEEEILHYTPKDARERFASVEAANKWYQQKERHVYFVMDSRGNIGGIAWFSLDPRESLHANYTFAIRMYDTLRGQHLAGDLLETAHEDLRSTGYSSGAWLVTDLSNERAVQFYTKHDYEMVGSEADRAVMVRK